MVFERCISCIRTASLRYSFEGISIQAMEESLSPREASRRTVTRKRSAKEQTYVKPGMHVTM